MHCLFSSLQTSTRRLLTVTLVISLCLPAILTTCSNDADCSFGRCDRERRECRCGVECNSNNYIQHVVCSRRTCVRNGNGTNGCGFRSVCEEFADECSSRIASRFIRLTANTDSDIFNGDCSNILYGSDSDSEEQFCRDQSICSNNGICVQDARKKTRTCICDDHHTGQRCDTIIPSTNSVSQSTTRKPGRRNSYNGGNTPASTSSSMLPTVLVIASPCMLIGFIFIKRQRRLSESLPTTRSVEKETETTERITGKDNPAKIVVCKLINNRHDFDDCVQTFSPTNNCPVEAQSKDFNTVVTLYNDNDYVIGTTL